MTTNRELFAKHRNLGAFVETGTCFGRSVKIALELGFEIIRSVEASPERYEKCVRLFKGNPQVKLWFGPSTEALAAMTGDLPGPVLFWLDAHPSGAGSFGNDYNDNPAHRQFNILLDELIIIAKRNVADVILVDDLAPDIEAEARSLFPLATITVYDTDEGPNKVMEIVNP